MYDCDWLYTITGVAGLVIAAILWVFGACVWRKLAKTPGSFLHKAAATVPGPKPFDFKKVNLLSADAMSCPQDELYAIYVPKDSGAFPSRPLVCHGASDLLGNSIFTMDKNIYNQYGVFVECDGIRGLPEKVFPNLAARGTNGETTTVRMKYINASTGVETWTDLYVWYWCYPKKNQ